MFEGSAGQPSYIFRMPGRRQLCGVNTEAFGLFDLIYLNGRVLGKAYNKGEVGMQGKKMQAEYRAPTLVP